ncbi:MAG: retron Ec67 family RNA-directed DNA polymerase/endonuclease, partial [Methanobacteriaceae archaeon]|nr:retron Ec67 family RNA-directed DNA polymerase/endonuclease [Methanobacteriaceae archaeon]
MSWFCQSIGSSFVTFFSQKLFNKLELLLQSFQSFSQLLTGIKNMSENDLERLRNCKDLQDFSKLIGYKKTKNLSYIIYKIPENLRYNEFKIKKKNSEFRIIHAPVEKLKTVQSRLSSLLQNCYDLISVDLKSKEILSHGFIRGRSIITNALIHKNKRFVFNIDIENFFGSINFGRVRGFFIKNRYFKLNENIATIIAKIACHNNSLPQGSPCSPIISNLIASILDIYLFKLCKKYKLYYSRYVDDLTISTNLNYFPENIAYKNPSSKNEWVIGNELTKIFERVNFKFNFKKTRMQLKNSRQEVTGLIVNKKVNVKYEYKKKVRAMIHNLFMNGKIFIKKEDKEKNVEVEKKINSLHGMIQFIGHIIEYQLETFNLSKVDKKNENAISNMNYWLKMYENFIIYKYFYGIKAPTIITEGKTDTIYLKCAIERLNFQFCTNSFSSLSKAICFHPHTHRNNFQNKIKNKDNYKKSFDKKLKRKPVFLGGNSGATFLMKNYIPNNKLFKNADKILSAPLIYIIDNDESGKKSLNNFLSNKKFINHRLNDNTCFVGLNLYIIKLPQISSENNDYEIEDYFDTDTLSSIIDGKSFNKSNDSFDIKDVYFGKMDFALKIIKNNKNNIDFSKFNKLLDEINFVIQDFYNNKRHQNSLVSN